MCVTCVLSFVVLCSFSVLFAFALTMQGAGFSHVFCSPHWLLKRFSTAENTGAVRTRSSLLLRPSKTGQEDGQSDVLVLFLTPQSEIPSGDTNKISRVHACSSLNYQIQIMESIFAKMQEAARITGASDRKQLLSIVSVKVFL